MQSFADFKKTHTKFEFFIDVCDFNAVSYKRFILKIIMRILFYTFMAYGLMQIYQMQEYYRAAYDICVNPAYNNPYNYSFMFKLIDNLSSNFSLIGKPNLGIR